MLSKSSLCHSERSEESRICLLQSPNAGFLSATLCWNELIAYFALLDNCYIISKKYVGWTCFSICFMLISPS